MMHPDGLGEVCGLCPKCRATDFLPCGDVHDCQLCREQRLFGEAVDALARE